MIRKYATLETLSSSFAANSLRRSAHKADFSGVPVRPGYLYVRSRAISSRTNDNYDTFPAEEIKKGYKTFIGKPVFVNHENENHRRARGVILDAQLHEDTNPDGTPDTWVEVMMEVDAIRFPKLAEAIVKGHIERTSMGVDVEMSACGACGNEAVSPMDYCAHIPRMKGSKIRKVTASGTQQDVLIHEVCYGLNFFENSLLVEDPADPTAFFLGVDTRGLEMQATKRAIATRKRAASRKPKAFGGRKVSALSKTSRSKVAERKTTHLPCGCSIIPAFTQGVRSGNLVADGWHLIDNQGHWAQTYWTKAEAKESHASYPPCQMTTATKRKVGYGEVVAPPKVDTLRQDTCPICGGNDYNGDQCLVCGFTKPPEMFMDPDLDAAGLADLREDNAGANPGLDTDNPVVDDVLAGDVQPLECDNCGAQFDASPEMAQQPPGQVEQAQTQQQPIENPANTGPVAPGSALGDVPPPPPNNSTDKAPGKEKAEPEPPAGKGLPKSKKDSDDETHDDPKAQSDDKQPKPSNNDAPKSEDSGSTGADAFSNLKAGDPCPECGGGTVGNPTEDNPLGATDDNPDPDNDGDDDRLGSENDPDHAEEEKAAYKDQTSDDDEEDDEDDDEDKKSKSGPSDNASKSKKEVKTSRRASARRRSQKEDSMARPLVQAVAEQQKIIRSQAAELRQLRQAVRRIETLAGIRRNADAANPAQPIPQPGGGAAYPGSSLEEARTPGARGNVMDIGGVADSKNVGAYTTDSVDNIGMSSPSGYDITQDVTTPVAGTESMRPIDEVRTRPVIEFGNPLKPDFAFPLEGDFAQRATVDSSARIYASLRLARLRIEAGTAEYSSNDEIAEGEGINKDDSKSDSDIQNEIETTSKVLRSQGSKQSRTAARNLVPQSRGGRQTPSVAKVAGISVTAANSGDDDAFLFI